MAKGTISVQIKYNNFAKIARAYPAKVGVVVRKTANDLIRLATPATPYLTGFLRGSATVDVAGETEASVSWGAEYAAYQEFGTRYIAGSFFATNAAKAVQPAFIAALKELEP